MTFFRQVHALGNSSNGLPKAKLCILNNDIVVVEMDMYGPNLTESPPQDEQVCFMPFLSISYCSS